MTTRVLQVGQVQLHRVPEVTVAYAPGFLFKDLPPGFIETQRDSLPAWSVEANTERIYLYFQSFLLRHAGRTILLDTCNGNHKERPDLLRWHRTNFPWLSRLADTGSRPEDIDIVLCSHLHADHVGWNTRLEDGRWVPTFPNARYVVSRTEIEHWQAQHTAAPEHLLNHGAYQDSVLPILAAGLLDMVEDDHLLSHDVDLQLSLEPAPGHTPGHVHLVMRGRGQEVIYSADTLHHPLQVAHPEYGLTDGDATVALHTRRKLIERCAATGAILLPAHFGFPGTIHHSFCGPIFRSLTS